MQKPADDLFQFEVLGADEMIPVAISPLLDEVTATMLFERSAVGPGYELQLHYRGVLVRRRDRESEQRIVGSVVASDEDVERSLDGDA